MRQPSLYVREQFRVSPASLVALVVGAIALLGLILWLRAPSLSQTDTQARAAYRISLDAISLAGTREKLLVLQRWQSGEGATANLLIVNSDDASSRWMFPDNTQTILKRDELHAVDSQGAWSPVTGLVLTVSTGNGESLYYYRVGGGPAVRFLTADSIISGDQVGNDRYLVVASHDGKVTAALYSLVDFKVLSEKAAPDIPQ